MAKVPVISGQEAIKAFERADFYIARTRGSHSIMKKDGHREMLSIPVHAGKTLGRGLLKSQILAAGLTVAEFCELL